MSDNESLHDQEQQLSHMKSTHKRRSSVFSYIPRELEADSTNDEEEERQVVPEIPKDKEFDLSAYINKLKNERKEWKEELNARKSERRKLQKQKSNIKRRGVDFDINILSESERSFLLARPNYQQICKNIQILADSAVKIATLNREIENLNNRLTLKMEEKLLAATKNLIEISSTEN